MSRHSKLEDQTRLKAKKYNLRAKQQNRAQICMNTNLSCKDKFLKLNIFSLHAILKKAEIENLFITNRNKIEHFKTLKLISRSKNEWFGLRVPPPMCPHPVTLMTLHSQQG